MKLIIKTNRSIMMLDKSYGCMLLIFVLLSSCTCLNKIHTMPPDFDFIAQYGIADGNIINTFNSTFTKRIDWDKDTVVSLSFASQEKEKVYNKIKRYRIDEFPVYFVPESIIDVSPSPTYYLMFKINDTFYYITWEINTFSKEKSAKRLRTIFSQIINYLNKQEIITNLPDDKRGVY